MSLLRGYRYPKAVGACRRGKNDQKHYTVFICSLAPKDKAAFEPQLNHEHSKWRWFPLEKLAKRDDLHPIVKQTIKAPNKDTVMQALGL